MQTKKRKEIVVYVLLVYGLFLINKIVITKHTTIATMIPATAGTKYISAADSAGASVGAGVADAASATKVVCANDGQYDLEPAKVAITL
jgi:hypothetical protein